MFIFIDWFVYMFKSVISKNFYFVFEVFERVFKREKYIF